jgi:GNAT superfamily N-acetyltransferase
MAERDVAAAERCAHEAFEAAAIARDEPPSDRSPTEIARRSHRIAHLLATDPGGAWVAEADGEIVGVALALVREGVWGLSLFAVRPGLQGQGIGRRTLEPVRAYAEGRRGAIILSSIDPRAMRRYARAGFRLRPCVDAAGQINRSRLPGGLRSRPGDVTEDRDLLDAVSRHVRTATHGPDFGAIAAAGGELLVLDGRGYAFHREGSPVLLAATDEAAAGDLLWSCLAAGPPGGPAHIDFISEHNDWAVAVALDAGLTLSPAGPVFVRGQTGPFTPYLPNGAYL